MPLMSSPATPLDTPLAASTSLRTSTSMVNNASGSSIHQSPQAATKYAKIQPAIAIKPKPNVQAPASKPAFNPRYDPTALSTANLLHDEAQGNINTSRKWVLPPRPRPGRKPTSAAPVNTSVPPDKSLFKKKLKVQKRDDPLPSSSLALLMSPGAGSLSAASSQNASPGPIGLGLAKLLRIVGSPASQLLQAAEKGQVGQTMAKNGISATNTNTKELDARPLQPALKQVVDLQLTYLAKLKEQELIRNYIEVLTNQIKELKFVQSGIITVDALNSDNGSKPKLPHLLPSEQIDRINNVNDLDKFLAHMTTQSNVIHSVTKKFVGNSLNQELHLQLQIRYYLELRAKNSKVGSGRSLESHRQQQGATPSTQTRSLFTPSLLRPLKMNLFDAEDEVIDVDILNEGDSLLPASGADKLKFDVALLTAADLDFLNLGNSPEQKPAVVPKKPKKIGCGFCNSETPCVCFDADNIFGEPK